MKSIYRTHSTRLAVFLVASASLSHSLFGQNKPAPRPPPPPTPQSLKTVKVPEPSDLNDFIRDKQTAIVLGKALFWDMQVGSDGVQACGTCHFHAGADSRSKNQLSPGLKRMADVNTPNPDNTFQVGPPNYQLKRADYPFRKLADINDRGSRVISDVNDVTGSQGVTFENFGGLTVPGLQEILNYAPDPVFKVGGINTRRVEPRNTPTMINAIFNIRNFWDGRAQERFNGVNPFGLRDQGAFVWRADSPKDLMPVSIALDHASLASQAVGPPEADFEMSAHGRPFPQVGRKLLNRRPLNGQLVHPQDSVLGCFSLSPIAGLSVDTYAELIRRAFQPKWWQGDVNLQTNKKGHPRLTGFTHMEANFSLYFGLSVQLYEATLVSDQTPFDSFAEGNTAALTEQQKRGLDLFFGRAKCINCHSGAEFSNATFSHIQKERLERMVMGNDQLAVYDSGFYNIGVRPTLADLGVGGLDPFGNPLSESRLAQQLGEKDFKQLLGMEPNIKVTRADRIAANGAFKAPSLRNVELTAPYFHNGGKRTLREVVDFYNRGGDFGDQNIADFDPDVMRLNLSNTEKESLVAFLKSLTDERVRSQKAPFDHPQIDIPNGHLGNQFRVVDEGNLRARDNTFRVPAVGKDGGRLTPNFLE